MSKDNARVWMDLFSSPEPCEFCISSHLDVSTWISSSHLTFNMFKTHLWILLPHAPPSAFSISVSAVALPATQSPKIETWQSVIFDCHLWQSVIFDKVAPSTLSPDLINHPKISILPLQYLWSPSTFLHSHCLYSSPKNHHLSLVVTF